MTSEIIIILQGIILVFVGVGVKWIISINVHLTKLNGRLNTVEAWQESHEKRDDERHQDVEKRIDRMGNYIREGKK